MTLRHLVHPRTTFAAPRREVDGPRRCLWQAAARRGVSIGAVLLAPLAVVAGVAGWLLFAILLPICGIATIAESLAHCSWKFLRGVFSPENGGATARE
jgi:hypothetical protein